MNTFIYLITAEMITGYGSREPPLHYTIVIDLDKMSGRIINLDKSSIRPDDLSIGLSRPDKLSTSITRPDKLATSISRPNCCPDH